MFKTFLVEILAKLGVDRAVAFTVASRGLSTLFGPINVIVICTFLNPAEQGFYYTFASLLSLQVFVELGLTFVVLQCASHERARLELTSEGVLSGDAERVSRLVSLTRLALKWYSVAATAMVLILLPVGRSFLFANAKGAANVLWQVPWTAVVLGSALALVITPLLAILEGCGFVAEIASMRTVSTVIGALVLWVGLLAGFKLFACALVSWWSVLWQVLWLLSTRRITIRQLLFSRVTASVSWRTDVWPFQWRIALSWMSGYLIFQLFNPMLFAMQGPVVAGRMGMSLNTANSLANLAMAWMITKSAPFGNLVACEEYETLDRLFFATLRRSWCVLLICCCAAFLVILGLNIAGHRLASRFLDPLTMAILLLNALVNHIVSSEALYLRAHKREPFLVTSLVLAVLVPASSYLFGRAFGPVGMVSAYFSINLLIGLGIGTIIFVNCRRMWHGPRAGAVIRTLAY